MPPAASTKSPSPDGSRPPLRPRTVPKGRQTRVAILDAALRLATRSGLEGLSIGTLAELTGMSKSGVFAHFGSREGLQIAVLNEYHGRFEDEVFAPAMREHRGLPRLRALIALWLQRVSAEIDSGCIYISGAVEFDDRPGPVRDALVAMVRTWRQALDRAIRAAIASGDLRADTDPQQVLFEIHGLVLALHHDARFLQSSGARGRAQRAFDRLIESRRAPATGSPAPCRRAALAPRGPVALRLRGPRRPRFLPSKRPSHKEFSDGPLHPAAARHAVRDA